jgi:hypothetical protein
MPTIVPGAGPESIEAYVEGIMAGFCCLRMNRSSLVGIGSVFERADSNDAEDGESGRGNRFARLDIRVCADCRKSRNSGGGIGAIATLALVSFPPLSLCYCPALEVLRGLDLVVPTCLSGPSLKQWLDCDNVFCCRDGLNVQY